MKFTLHELRERKGKNNSHLITNSKILHSRSQDQNCLLIKMQYKAIFGIILIKLGIFKLVGKDCRNLAIGLGNSSVFDLVTEPGQWVGKLPVHA